MNEDPVESTSASDDRSNDAFAADYDEQVRAYGWWGHEALFGMCFEYIHLPQRLLDVGIGTGLASTLFARAGLEVFGFDSSLEMLKRCRAKNIAIELKQHDLAARPWPYPEASFQHVIMCGVLHFISDLGPVFDEVGRVIRQGGIFAFTTKAAPSESSGVIQQMIDGMAVFSHAKSTVEVEIARHGFEVLKCLRLGVGRGDEWNDSFFAFVTRKVAE